jgi:1-acyl-sn-glycerol-3-phosphate acyltransferase/nucleoside-diphosphate-sugar epimerase
MSRIALLIRGSNLWAQQILHELRLLVPDRDCVSIDTGDLAAWAVADAETACVYIPALTGRDGSMPDWAEAAEVLEHAAAVRPKKLVLLSSALVYGISPGRQSLVAEDHVPPSYGKREISGNWKSLETLAHRHLDGTVPLTILRAVTVMPSPALLSRRLQRKVTVTMPGHNPTLQLLSIQDLARALLCAVEVDKTGVFNVAPEGVVPLKSAVRIGKGHRLPVARTLQRLAWRKETLDFLRYPWTVSGDRIQRELGFLPHHSSVGAIRKGKSLIAPADASEPCFDPFGMDRNFIEALSRTIVRFMSERYWRVETKGLDNVPRQGPVVLAGTHRGFMPWDAVVALHLLLNTTGRVVRFLVHPGLLKFPFISGFIARMGGVVACQESADRVLQSGEMLGVYPEGVQGAFARLRDAYKVLNFGRHDFVKLALRHRAPIQPFVNVGSAEALPIFAQIKSRFWIRYSDWPCLPISTFPFLPLPLPSKWHIQFLPVLHVERQYPPEAADDPGVVREISRTVRKQMQEALEDMVGKRPSIFYGDIFAPESRESHKTSAPGSS